MNVSLSRKIHIIALPHGTTKACLSDPKSPTTPGRPGVNPAGSTTLVASPDIATPTQSSRLQEHAEQYQPDQQQEVPVHRAQLDRKPHGLDGRIGAKHPQARTQPRDETADQVRGVDTCQQVERGVGRVARSVDARSLELPPRETLADDERSGKDAAEK